MPKPQFWGYRHERKELSAVARRSEDRAETRAEPDAPTPHRRKKGAKPYRLEYRLRPEYWEEYRARWENYFSRLSDPTEWHPSGNYETARSRDEALTRLSRTDGRYEYRRAPSPTVV